MKLDALLSTIILVSFLVTIIMAVGSYAAYKLREARRPHAGDPHAGDPHAASPAPGESAFFERVRAEDVST
ncbi:MAG: hypothetical protein ACJ8AO_13440 [Gemmatimonadaceae bacterium]